MQYEICKSLQKGDAVIGVHINNIRDMRTQKTSLKGNIHTIFGHYSDNSSAYFDDIADGIYDYINDDGYYHFCEWIEQAAKTHNYLKGEMKWKIKSNI